jgi:hypothetical protein
MALSFVGSKTFTHSLAAAQSCSLTDLLDSSGAAAALQQGDYVFIAVAHAGTTTRTLAQVTPGTGSDYTSINPTVLTSSDTNITSFGGFYKKMGAVPDTAVSIPAAATAGSTSVSVTVEAWRGVDPTTPLSAVTPTTASGINGGQANAPSITTPASPGGVVVIGMFGAATASGTTTAFTAPTTAPYDSTTNVFRSAINTSSTGSRAVSGMGAKTGLGASTAFDASACGGSSSANTASWAALSFVLRPIAKASASPTLDVFLSAAAVTAKVKGVGSGTLNPFTASATATVTTVSPITATASATLDSFLSAAAAKALVEGVGSGTLNAFGSTSSAQVKVKTTASPTLSSFTANAAAAVKVKAAAAPVLSAFTSAAAAKALIEGIGSGTLNAFAAASAAQVKVKAAASPALSTFTTNATAAVKVKAAAVPVLSAFTSAAAAKALIEGIGSGTLNPFSSSGNAKVIVKTNGQVTFDAFASVSAVKVRVRLSGDADLDPFVSDAAMRAPVEGFGAGILSPFALESTARVRVSASASPTLDAFTATGEIAGSLPITAVASPTLDAFISSAAAQALVEGTGSGTLNAFAIQASARVRIKATMSASISDFSATSVLSGPFVLPEKFIARPRVKSRCVPVCGRCRVVDRTRTPRTIVARIIPMNNTTRAWAAKRAGEVDYRGVNWKYELDEGETIAGYSFTADDGSGVTAANKVIDGTKTVATLSGGVAGRTAQIVASVTTSNGRVLELLLKMPIE